MATSSQSAVAAADSFAIARELLLDGAGLELAALERALATAMVRKLDYVDLYLQLTRYETWTVEDGIVKEGAYSIDQGIGVRAISDCSKCSMPGCFITAVILLQIRPGATQLTRTLSSAQATPMFMVICTMPALAAP